jgi:hypothetical protein
MLEETSQMYTRWGENVSAEPHLFQSKTEQTAHFDRPSISGRSNLFHLLRGR